MKPVLQSGHGFTIIRYTFSISAHLYTSIERNIDLTRKLIAKRLKQGKEYQYNTFKFINLHYKCNTIICRFIVRHQWKFL